MIKNIKAKHEEIRYLKFVKKTAENNLKHAVILQNATTHDLIEAREHLIGEIVKIKQKNDKINKKGQFHGLLHYVGKKAYEKANDIVLKRQLAKFSQALTCVNEILNARTQNRNIDHVANIQLQIANTKTSLKIAKKKKFHDYTIEQ